MSVLIKGMEMPSECRVCAMTRYFFATGTTVCIATLATLANNYKTIQFEGRHEKCPLVELPEKHGNLIDRDALWNDLEILYERRDGRVNWNYALVRIKTAPTIVEAEGEEVAK
jgi:hypothetical protein